MNLLYWAIGQPFPATDGSGREGDNLYNDSVVALDLKTGKLRWHFQFTPHDLHDWDANEPLVLADTRFQGRDRKLLLQANRNGFFYVLDRTNGEFLLGLGKAFAKKATWASDIGPDGRPQTFAGHFSGSARREDLPCRARGDQLILDCARHREAEAGAATFASRSAIRSSVASTIISSWPPTIRRRPNSVRISRVSIP